MLNFMMTTNAAKKQKIADLSNYHQQLSSYQTIKAIPQQHLDYLMSIDVATSVNNMWGSVFGGCQALLSIPAFKFDTTQCAKMTYMFGGCSSLTSLDLSYLKTDNCIDMSNMFGGCSSLASLDLSTFNFQKCKHMTQMFDSCTNLKTIDLTGVNTSACVNMDYMFFNCKSLTDVYGYLDMTNTVNCYNMFYGSNIRGLHLKNVPYSLPLNLSGGYEGEHYIIDNYI